MLLRRVAFWSSVSVLEEHSVSIFSLEAMNLLDIYYGLFGGDRSIARSLLTQKSVRLENADICPCPEQDLNP
jgi:hypothetical protein